MDARLSLVPLLALQKDARAAALLREMAAGDPARPVRERAARELRALGETPPPPGPEPIVRPALDYREALAPYEVTAGASVFTPRVFLYLKQGRIEIHLNVVEAPLMSATFLDLARSGFFTNLTFHRVVPGFVIQGGDPRGDGEGGPGYTVRDELSERTYLRGTVGIALDWPDTGGSQFFITHSPQPHLDAKYTVIGRVINGMDVVDRIQQNDLIRKVRVWDGEQMIGE